LHRAYHALPSFTSPKGEPTGAVYGFASMLLKIIKDLKPDYMAAGYDLAEPTFRHAAYEKYKATRPKTEEELSVQFGRSREVLEAFHIPIYEEAGFEADDIIGTIVEENKTKKDLEIVIASGDLDTLQLVSGSKVTVFTLRKGNEEAIYDEKAVKTRFGFGPALLPDFKGLMGDPSDNIIGIKGIGEKTAMALVQKFGPLEKILELAKSKKDALKKEGFKDRVISLLAEGEEEALFSKTLATIRRDAPIKIDFKKAEWKSFDKEKLQALFRELGFSSLIARMPGGVPDEAEKPKPAEGEFLKKLSVASWLLDSKRTNPTFEEIMSASGAKTAEEALKKLELEIAVSGLDDVYRKIELPLIAILKEVEENGILIDTAMLKKLSRGYERQLGDLVAKIHKLAGEEFNINSTKELRRVLFEKLGLETKGLKKTGGGEKSTKLSELNKLKNSHPVIELILKYRTLAKLKSTYIDALPKLADKNGRLHTTFLQAGTVTGRLSSRDPNLQNIPIRTELGREIRGAFKAPHGCFLLAADYSQIELRVAAILSGDQKMKLAFAEGKDIHAITASEIFNVAEKEVSREMRRAAKVINFGILYGMGARALAENLGISRDQAELYIQEYFHDFAGVRKYVQAVIEKARENGYVETMFGRRRFLPEINSQIPVIRAEAERMAVNFPIQGTATGDMIKLAIIRIHGRIEKDKALAGKVKIILQVHDELLFEVEKGAVEEAARAVKEEMEGVLKADVPIKVELKFGPNWADMKSINI